MGNAVIHDESRGGMRKLFAKPFLWVVAAAIVIVGGSIGGVTYWMMHRDNSSANKTTALKTAQKTASSSANRGDYAASLSTLQQAEASGAAKSKAEKVELYTNLAAAAASNGQVADAISYLNKKHEADPSTVGSDAFVMGSYYERSGEIAKAIEQYELAIRYEQDHANQYTPSEVAGIQARINTLKGTQ